MELGAFFFSSLVERWGLVPFHPKKGVRVFGKSFFGRILWLATRPEMKIREDTTKRVFGDTEQVLRN